MNKRTLYSFIFLLFASVAHTMTAYFYGAVVMQHTETGKILILLADVHIQRPDINKKQILSLIYLIKELKARQYRIDALVEDMSTFLREKNNEMSLPVVSNSILGGITSIFDCHHIPCVNVEFRDDSDVAYKTDKKNSLINTCDSILLQRLLHNYHNYDDNNERSEAIGFDIALMNELAKSTTDCTFIACGGLHLASIMRILYTKGYKNIHVTVPDTPAWCAKFFEDIDTGAPLPSLTCTEEVMPLEKLKETVLALIVQATAVFPMVQLNNIVNHLPHQLWQTPVT